MSWQTKLSLIAVATLLAMLIVFGLEGDYAVEARTFLRNLLRQLF